MGWLRDAAEMAILLKSANGAEIWGFGGVARFVGGVRCCKLQGLCILCSYAMCEGV